jgi:thiol-disulfide isomerase/thioredoxin
MFDLNRNHNYMKGVFLLLIAFFCTTNVWGQEKGDMKAKADTVKDTLPYQKYPTLPAFNIMLTDSSTIVNTYNIPEGKPTLIMFFDPECKHCQAETKMLLNGMDSLKDIRFYMITSVHDFSKIRNFYNDYHLSDYKNIEVVGRDYEYFFITYYGIKFVPDMVLYDGHKNLVKFFEGHVTTAELYRLVH